MPFLGRTLLAATLLAALAASAQAGVIAIPGPGTQSGTLASTSEHFAFGTQGWAASGHFGETGPAERFQIAFTPDVTITSETMTSDAGTYTWSPLVGPGPWTAPSGIDPAVAFFSAGPAADLVAGQSFGITIDFAKPVGNYAFAADWITVPEPTSLAALGVGLLGLGMARRRRGSTAR